MSIQLRQYQNESISALRRAFSIGHKQSVLCLPTGAGKTVVFSYMAAKAVEKGSRVLVLTDRIELFGQTFRAISKSGVSTQLLQAGVKNIDPYAMLTLAMIETFKRRNTTFYKPDLIIIDECHKASFCRVLDQYPDTFIIGATATPVGKHFHKYYKSIIETTTIAQLIGEGFLSPCRPFQMIDDFSDLETKRGEYTEKSLFTHYDNRKLYTGVVDEWLKRGHNKKTLVFNVNIEHTENMTEEFRKAGIVSECVTSKTPKAERERILKAYEAGLIPVLNNCGILTTGFDEPSIECIILNRKTKSLPLFLQMCGRGSRIYPGKDEFLVLDFGMNHDEHGLWEEGRTWSLKPPKKKQEREAPVKECPECAAMTYASAKVCKFCGYEFPIAEHEESEGVMVEVKPRAPEALLGRKVGDLSVDELIELQKSKKYKATFVWRIIRAQGRDSLQEYGEKMGYSKGWFRRQVDLLSDPSSIQFSNFTVR